jgi:hypothetical protein
MAKQLCSFKSGGAASSLVVQLQVWLCSFKSGSASSLVQKPMVTCDSALHGFCHVHARLQSSWPHSKRARLSTLGPLNIRTLEIFLGYVSPSLIELFTPKF